MFWGVSWSGSNTSTNTPSLCPFQKQTHVHGSCTELLTEVRDNMQMSAVSWRETAFVELSVSRWCSEPLPPPHSSLHPAYPIVSSTSGVSLFISYPSNSLSPQVNHLTLSHFISNSILSYLIHSLINKTVVLHGAWSSVLYFFLPPTLPPFFSSSSATPWT